MWKKRWEEEPKEYGYYLTYSPTHGYDVARYGKLYGPYNQQGYKTHAKNTRRLYFLGSPSFECRHEKDYILGFITGEGHWFTRGKRISDVVYFMEIPEVPEVENSADALKKQMLLLEERVARLEEQERYPHEVD